MTEKKYYYNQLSSIRKNMMINAEYWGQKKQ